MAGPDGATGGGHRTLQTSYHIMMHEKPWHAPEAENLFAKETLISKSATKRQREKHKCILFIPQYYKSRFNAPGTEVHKSFQNSCKNKTPLEQFPERLSSPFSPTVVLKKEPQPHSERTKAGILALSWRGEKSRARKTSLSCKISTKLSHDSSMAQSLLCLLSRGIVLFHILGKWREKRFSRSTILPQGLT